MDATASSRTSPRTSTSSSTSDRAAAHLGGLIRLVHPFPSLLDGAVVAAVALVASTVSVPTALLLGASMTSLQFAIGALNDLHDAQTDGGRTPPKPIPSGLVPADGARVVMVAAASVGLLLAATFGTGLLALAGTVLVIGFGYDLVARGTPWSWLPFAVGIPILPVYGWFGATGALPGWAVALVPAAAFAGAALAIANTRADVERDRSTGVVTIATHLGEVRVRAVAMVAWVGAALIALAWLIAMGATLEAIAPVIGACGVIAIGVALGWSGGPGRLEWAWRVQSIGAGVAAVVWLSAVAGLA